MDQAVNERSRSVLDAIEATVSRYPEELALVGPRGDLTYAQLWERATSLARHLCARGVSTGEYVGVLTEQGAAHLISLVGVMAAGGVYMPMDPSYPTARHEQMVMDADVRFIVAAEGFQGAASQLGVEVVDPFVDDDDMAIPLPLLESTDVAYLIFTSGSTGRPKGVIVEHGAILPLLEWLSQTCGGEIGYRVMGTAALSFDASLPNFYVPLMTGGTVVALDRAATTDPHLLAQAIEEYRPFVLQAPPTMLRMLSETRWAGDPNVEIWTGGERQSLATLKNLVPRVRRWCNFYGPTEAAVEVSMAELRADDAESPIGYSLPFASLLVLDEECREVPRGDVGELYIAGPSLARGYLKDEARTNERFVWVDDATGPVRAYRTGDLVRYREDGQLLILGRTDDQIKLRGYRIEPGEIETVLESQAGVSAAVVVVVQLDDDDEPRLTAVVTGSDEMDMDSMASRLSALLPAHMIPRHYLRVAALPMTASGKIDRKETRAVATEWLRSPATEATMNLPGDEVERTIHSAFATALGIDEGTFGVDEGFFDLGGTSLRCVRLFMEIEEAFDIDLPLTTVIAAPNVRGLSSVVKAKLGLEEPISEPYRPTGFGWETLLQGLWNEVLGRNDILPSDDFFALGGTRESAQVVLQRLRDEHGVTLGIGQFIATPTIAQISRIVSGEPPRDCLVPITTSGSKPPFFCVAGSGGLALAFLALAQELGPDQPFYGLQAKGMERRGFPDLTIAGAARRYAKIIQSVQPHGPYYLGGQSMGAVVAFHVARELEERGERVALLAVLDGILSDRLAGPDPVANHEGSPTTPSRSTSRIRQILRMRPRLSTMIRFPLMGIIRFKGSAQFEVFYRFGNFQAAFSPRMIPWNGRTVVFLSDADAAGVAKQWGKVLTGTWRSVYVGGTHNTMLHEPQVATLASALSEEIADAMATGER